MSDLIWEPTALEMQQATTVVLSDITPSLDAIFIHASPVREDELDDRLLDRAIHYRQQTNQPKLVLNSLSRAECDQRHIPYGGVERWQQLLQDRGVTDCEVVLLPPSPQTAAELRNFLALAQQQGWHRLGISSYNFHQLRCFLTAVAVMAEMDFWPAIYNVPGPPIPWYLSLYRMTSDMVNVTGDLDMVGNLPVMIEQEYQRIVAYAQPPEIVDGRPKYTRHATIPEMLAYLDRRAFME